MSEETSDPLARAIELSMQFASSGGDKDIETFLVAHEPLREILEPLLRPETGVDDVRVLGDFELIRELGRGGMGVVYEAIQTQLGRTVALKLLPPHRALSPRSLAMFRREAMLAASLDHPGIARVLEFQEIDGQLALAMELIDGLPLDGVLEGLPKSSPSTLGGDDLARAAHVVDPDGETPAGFRAGYEATVVELARQVADALAHAHSRGVVHRDVKPGNILLTPEGKAVLTDFGLAREEGMGGMTRTGEFAGTYQYAAPEQLEGRLDAIDGRTDIYALGATLYEMLTLQRPLEADSLTELFALIKREDPQPPSRINPRIPHDLEAVVLCALEKDPSRRYATAAEFATDLGHVLRGTPVKARRLSLPARSLRWVQRNRLVSAMVAVLLLSTVTVTVFAASAAASDAASRRHLSRYDNLWVGAALDGLHNRAARAHPPWPAQAAELTELVRIAEADLLGMRAAHVAAVDELRRGHVRAAGAPRSLDRPVHPAVARIAELREVRKRLVLQAEGVEVAAVARNEALAEAAALAAEIEELQASVAMSDRVQIPDRADAALHDRLEEQLFRLALLERELLADLRFRRDWALGIGAATVDAHAAAWQAAAVRVAGDARFAGVALTPQVGLVPLGPDPETGLEEFAQPLSGAVPQRGADGALRLGVEHAVVFVLLPGGDFAPARWQDPRTPAKHSWRVRLDPFLVAKHELGRAQWRRLARDVPGLRWWRDGGVADVRNRGELDKPVNGITWQMCYELLTRCGLELPTAAQWEYTTLFGGAWAASPDQLARVANRADLSYAAASRHVTRESVMQFDDGYAGLAPITSMEPMHSGVHHLLGNVSEWCRDAYSGDGTRPRDGDGLRDDWDGRNVLRVVCGGHWASAQPPVVLLNRFAADSAARSIGVRPARRLLTPEQERPEQERPEPKRPEPK